MERAIPDGARLSGLERFTFEKVKREAAAQRRPAGVSRNNEKAAIVTDGGLCIAKDRQPREGRFGHPAFGKFFCISSQKRTFSVRFLCKFFVIGAASFPFASDALRKGPELEENTTGIPFRCKVRRVISRRKNTQCFFAIRRGTVAVGKTAAFPRPSILPNKARWGGDGGSGGKGAPSRAGSDRMAAAGRARCDEGSYGHRQQSKGVPSPSKP